MNSDEHRWLRLDGVRFWVGPWRGAKNVPSGRTRLYPCPSEFICGFAVFLRNQVPVDTMQ